VSLAPFIDECGILRVGGILANAKFVIAIRSFSLLYRFKA